MRLASDMRRALPASAAIHGLFLLGAFWLAHPTRQDDAVSLQSIAVSLVSTQAASDSTSKAHSDATRTMVAAGAVFPDTPDPADLPAPDRVEPDLSDEVTATSPTDLPVTSAQSANAVASAETVAIPPARLPLAPSAASVASAAPRQIVRDTLTPIETTPVAPSSAAAEHPAAAVTPAVAIPLTANAPSSAEMIPPVPAMAVDAPAPVIAAPAPIAQSASSQSVTPNAPASAKPVQTAEVAPAIPVDRAVPVELDAGAKNAADPVPTAKPPVVEPATPTVAQSATESPLIPVAVTQPAQPAARKPPPRPERPERPTSRRRPAPAKPRSFANAGSGGKTKASSQAAPAFRSGAGAADQGGSAADTHYPGMVLAQLRRALRRPANGGFGEVKVGFTVLAGGGVADIHVVSSSGSAVLDEAAADTVSRAAPFPPIPSDAGRASWSFVMPLSFRQ